MRYNAREGWRYALVEDGVRFVFPVDGVLEGRPTVITGYTEVADARAAAASGRWSAADLDVVRLRTALAEADGESVAGRVRSLDVRRRVAVGDHEVTSPRGRAGVECADCGLRAGSKAVLDGRDCGGPRSSPARTVAPGPRAR